jgi:hypothetical protein
MRDGCSMFRHEQLIRQAALVIDVSVPGGHSPHDSSTGTGRVHSQEHFHDGSRRSEDEMSGVDRIR